MGSNIDAKKRSVTNRPTESKSNFLVFKPVFKIGGLCSGKKMVELQDLALCLDLVAVCSCGLGFVIIKQAYRPTFKHRLGSEITQTHRDRESEMV